MNTGSKVWDVRSQVWNTHSKLRIWICTVFLLSLQHEDGQYAPC